jgi:CheY-like chemotaxis protein
MSAPTSVHKRVLLVDDNFVTQEMLSLALTAEGYMVVTAANGRDAINRLKSCEPVDVILLDLSMPVMDGQHFREAQRENARLADIPIIVFSASREAERTATELGAAGCLTKPVSTTALLEAVNRCVEPSQAG